MSPLRQGDPDRLGPYQLTGRLGAGGMGVVYLARDPDGAYVAIKLVHATLAYDPEFRGRFRSEVERARQVPSFCTAEVLDADLDHNPPYLVVEYVDGPSLAEVVEDRGPLKAAALHSLAVGVATALSGIHGAGVIHRDLKPDNVLLAPGSPKVIDFGIARAFEATSQYTRTDQMVGTVAYMAPERFSSEPGTPLTAAADVFAWGCVVAYAGTGRTPFHGDSPQATAARILTQPPHLTGLPESLRDLVELSLSRNPEDRPTARELLDMLLGDRPSPVSAAPSPGSATAGAGASSGGFSSPGRVPSTRDGASRGDSSSGGDFSPGEGFSAHGSEGFSAHGSGGFSAHGSGGDELYDLYAPPVPLPPRRRSRRNMLVAAFALLLVVAGVGTVGFVITHAGARGGVPLAYVPPRDGGAAAGAGVPTSATPSPSPTRKKPTPTPSRTRATPVPVEPEGGEKIIEDPLDQPGQWLDSEIREQSANCFTKGVMRAGRIDRGTYQCVGPDEEIEDDFGVEVTTALQSAGSCAAIWFHVDAQKGGQVLRVCQDEITIGADLQDDKRVYDRIALTTRIGLKKSVRIHLVVREGEAEVFRGGRFAGRFALPDDGPDKGQVRLGLSVEAVDTDPPYAVTFANVDIRSL
ncbi:serine/threonine protein kinase [Winogradskya consettensis]|uniref:serine/threonine protein kinase n=1 Tax=Winogradskya consettensis TaxID=113560 RepID=UPI001FD02376|nr:serine/threonine-protein kinase [Actinoplanes consettensis]